MQTIARTIAAVLTVGVLLAVPAAAQTMYRCGSSFQDRPCAAGQAGQAIGQPAAAAPAAAPMSDAECRQRGADAQKMAWAREAGQTREQQLAKIEARGTSAARKDYERALVMQVYERRGSSAAIRAGIETDCAAAKQKAAETAAAARALGLQPAVPSGVPPAAPVGPGAEERRAAEQRVRQSAAAREAQRKAERCADLKLQVDSVRARQRSGCSAASMDSLNRQRRDLESRLSASGC